MNSGANFRLVFDNLLQQLIVEHMDQEEDIFARFMNGPAFWELLSEHLSDAAYYRIRTMMEGRVQNENGAIRI